MKIMHLPHGAVDSNAEIYEKIMKHKVKMKVKIRKKGFFSEKKVIEERTIYMDNNQYREYKKNEKKRKQEWNNRPYTLEEMMFYDDLFGD